MIKKRVNKPWLQVNGAWRRGAQRMPGSVFRRSCGGRGAPKNLI